MSEESGTRAKTAWYRQPGLLATVAVALLVAFALLYVLLGTDPDEAPIPEEILLEEPPEVDVDPEPGEEPRQPVEPGRDWERG